MKKKDEAFRYGLKLLRDNKNISARSLSMSVNLSESYVSKVEGGTLAPSAEAFYKIVNALGASDKEIILLLKLLGENN